jgi:hypothetical protein
MTGDGARRGTLVIHYVADDQRPPLDRGSPETEQGPAVANPRIRVCSTVVFNAVPCHARTLANPFATELIGRRTLMPHSLETGHESGQMQTEGTLRLGALGAERTPSG